MLGAMDVGSKMRLTDRKDIGVGRPDGRFATSRSCHPSPPLHPVPSAFIPASFAANRAAYLS